MDSLTQIVLGAAVGEAVLGRKIGNKAMFYGAIAGTIPDLDAIAGNFTDTITAIEIHRGFTHSIVFSVLFAPLFGWLISKIEKNSPANWKDWSMLTFWGLFTHPLLDAHTTWGTQLFWPLDLRLAYKNIFVIDPLYTIPFLVFLILAMRQKKDSSLRKRYNLMGLIVSSIYLLVITPGIKLYVQSKFEKALDKQNIVYERLDTRPSPFNSVLWSANVELKDEFLIADYSLFDSRPINFESYPKNYELAGNFRDMHNFHRLIDISEKWYTISKKGDQVYFNDLRFGKLDLANPESEFVFSYRLNMKDGELLATETEKDASRARELLPNLWNRILGN